MPLIVFTQTSQQNHNLSLCLSINLQINGFRIIIILWVQNRFNFLPVLDICLEINDFFLYFCQRSQWIHFHLHLIQQLTVTVSVNYQTKRLSFIHLVLLYSRYLILSIFVQHITLKVIFISLQQNTVDSRMEVARHYLIVVLHMHVFWIHFLVIFAVIIFLELQFVLSPHANLGREEMLQGCCSWEFSHPSILFRVLVDLNAVSLHKKQVRHEQSQRFSSARCQSIHNLLEHHLRLQATRIVIVFVIGIW